MGNVGAIAVNRRHDFRNARLLEGASGAPRLADLREFEARRGGEAKPVPLRMQTCRIADCGHLDPGLCPIHERVEHLGIDRAAVLVLELHVYAVSARETVRGYSGREDFWFIVAIRSEDEAEIRAGETAGGSGREGPPACNAPAILGRGEDPHRARGPAG